MINMNRIKSGERTSENTKFFWPASFRHKRSLKRNINNSCMKLHDERRAAALYVPSKYCLISTITQKYAFNPSHINKGTNAVHHDISTIFSSFRVVITVKTVTATKFISISNNVRPSHFTSSFKENIIFCTQLLLICVHKFINCNSWHGNKPQHTVRDRKTPTLPNLTTSAESLWFIFDKLCP